jgi:DNA-binding NtrC family response regulator
MSTRIKRLFIFPAELPELPELPKLRRSDVLLASTIEQLIELKKRGLSTRVEDLWLVSGLPPDGCPRHVAKDVRDRLQSYRRFAGVTVELVVIGGEQVYVEALEQVLASRQPMRHDEGPHTRLRLQVLEAEELLGESKKIRALRRRIDALAGDVCPVLVVGPTGSGKELVAARLHERSGREGVFTSLNGAMLTPDLAESKLFGHIKGAFTGADRNKKGRIEEARDGTFFLDELFHVPASVQPKLLRAIAKADRGRIHIIPLGSTTEHPLEVRLVTAVQRHPLEGGERSPVRDDLYYRVAGEVLEVPPLVERLDDLELLVRHFAEGDVVIEPGVLDLLRQHPWPGNVRELKIVVGRATRRDPERITAANIRACLDPTARASTPVIAAPCDLERELAVIELHSRERAVERYGTQAEAAEQLQVNPKDWKRKMEKLREKVSGS